MTYRLPAFNALRAYEAAARHMSFKIAASELGVTAGAVSQQVKKLEVSLGVALFRRLPHGLLLTEEGETYLPYISKVFDDLTDATEAIAPKINSKKFRVGICEKAAAQLPSNWPGHHGDLDRFIRDCVRTSDVEAVWNNEVDCLLRVGNGPYGDLTAIGFNVPGSSAALHFICKTGYADCRQSRAILKNLENILEPQQGPT